MLFFISILFLLLIIFTWQNNKYMALLLVVASKSIIDATWSTRIGAFSLISIEGILIPILFFETLNPKYVGNRWAKMGWLLFLSLSIGIPFGLIQTPLNAIEGFVTNINILLAFFLIPVLVDTREKFRKLLIAILLGGIFPILISFYQQLTGTLWQERQTVGMIRFVGFYHDQFPVRFYGVFTLFAGLLYLRFFPMKRIVGKLCLILIMLAALVTIYNVYSKAATTILTLWGVILFAFSKDKTLSIAIIVSVMILIPLIFDEAFVSTYEQLFSKEIGYNEGEIEDARYTLAGRGYIWESYWNAWINEQNLLMKITGDGINRPVHNEFFRVLLASGILGLLGFVWFLIRMGYLSLNNKGPFKPFVFMLVAMFLIDSVGLVPGMYYYYNILTWGFIGLFLLRGNLLIYDTNGS